MATRTNCTRRPSLRADTGAATAVGPATDATLSAQIPLPIVSGPGTPQLVDRRFARRREVVTNRLNISPIVRSRLTASRSGRWLCTL